MVAKTATAALATKVAGCGENTIEADYLACFVLFANEYTDNHSLEASLGLQQEIDILIALEEHVAKLNHPQSAQSMQLAFRFVLATDASGLVSISEGDSVGADQYAAQYGPAFGDYLRARRLYLQSIGTTVEAAGFEE